MVRTKSDRVPAKVSGGKSAAKAGKSTPMRIAIGGSNTKGKSSSGGGNRAHPRDTPEWQKPITGFFNQHSTEGISPGASTSEDSQAASNQSAEQASGNESE